MMMMAQVMVEAHNALPPFLRSGAHSSSSGRGVPSETDSMSEDELRGKLGERALSRHVIVHEDSDVSRRQVVRGGFVRGGIVFEAHRLLYHSTLGLRDTGRESPLAPRHRA